VKIAVVAHGSRGDVQPPMALACRLIEAGHEVTLVVPSDFADAAGRLGARTIALPAQVRADLDHPAVLGPLRRGETLATFRAGLQIELQRMGPLQDAVVEATEGADLIVAAALLEDICISAAEARQQQITLAFPSPVWPNVSYPHLIVAGSGLPRVLNGASHALFELGALQLLPLINQTRRKLGLRAVRRRPVSAFRRLQPPVFYWVPPQVVPPPVDYGPNHHFTGYWAPPPSLRAALGEQEPSGELRRFLEAGAPPVYVGFGSMPVLDGAISDAVHNVADALGLRVVLGVGWSQFEPRASARVLPLFGSVDHDWLLPRCAAAVHHGGASTTAAAIRAGVPAVVASVFADNPLWGRRGVDLGLGDAFALQRLSATRLRRGLERALAPATQARARMFAAELAAAPEGAQQVARLVGEHEFVVPRPL
jgi:UDP:flavonoid glycosyltransferase YjiC (YdhE family)